MADFCRTCTAELWEVVGTDIEGPRWALCEGCGLHHFDRRGERTCGLATPAEEDVTGNPCPLCWATVEATSGDH